MRRMKPLAHACTLALVLMGVTVGQPALAEKPVRSKPRSAELLHMLEKMNVRLDQLEKRNAELEKRLAETAGKPVAPALEKRLASLEQAQEAVAKGLESEYLSEREPELTARLKAAETDVLNMKKSVQKIDALDGLAVGAALTTVAQRPSGLPHGTADAASQLGYRADLTASLPLDSLGDIEQKLFVHFRLGQNAGLNGTLGRLGTFASATNAVGFHASGAPTDDAAPMLGEAWYQAAIPLPLGGFKPNSRETLEVAFGKMDLFGFFDRNEAAGDEASQFLNSAFVHNPLLDAGGLIGMDANGFQPGVVASYVNDRNKPETWRLSLGAFGTRDGAGYQRGFSSPLVMAQAEAGVRLFGGLAGNYRLYAWRNGQGSELDGSRAKHVGWGVSADQRIDDGVMLFGRYGHQVRGGLTFDRAITLGGEIAGSPWQRGGDALGLAIGRLRASREFQSFGGSGDLTGDGRGSFAWTPSGAEQVTEAYYRYRLTKQFHLSPDLQWIRHAGANPEVRSIRIVGLRAQVSY